MIKVIRTFLAMMLILIFQSEAFSQKELAGDISLERLIDAALSINPGIKDGFAKTEISKTEINLSKSALLPGIYSDAFYSLTNQNSVGNDYGSVSIGISLNQTLW